MWGFEWGCQRWNESLQSSESHLLIKIPLPSASPIPEKGIWRASDLFLDFVKIMMYTTWISPTCLRKNMGRSTHQVQTLHDHLVFGAEVGSSVPSNVRECQYKCYRACYYHSSLSVSPSLFESSPALETDFPSDGASPMGIIRSSNNPEASKIKVRVQFLNIQTCYLFIWRQEEPP